MEDQPREAEAEQFGIQFRAVRDAIRTGYAATGASGQMILAALGQEMLAVAETGRETLPQDKKLPRVIAAYGNALLVTARAPQGEIRESVQKVFAGLMGELRKMERRGRRANRHETALV